MSKRLRHFVTKAEFDKSRVLLKKKLIESKNTLINCMQDCLISLSVSNVYSLGNAISNYNSCVFEFRSLRYNYARSKQHFLDLKNLNLLTQEEIDLYDKEFNN